MVQGAQSKWEAGNVEPRQQMCLSCEENARDMVEGEEHLDMMRIVAEVCATCTWRTVETK